MVALLTNLFKKMNGKFSKAILASALIHGAFLIGLLGLSVGMSREVPFRIMVFPVIGNTGVTAGRNGMLTSEKIIKNSPKNLLMSSNEKITRKSRHSLSTSVQGYREQFKHPGRDENQASGASEVGEIEARIQPEYPQSSRMLGEEGRTTVEVVLDQKGKVLSTKIVESSGHPRLDEAAISALVRGTFLLKIPSNEAIRKKFSVVFRLTQ